MPRDYIEVGSQGELDKAIADGNIPICRKGFFTASDSASVWASGSASVEAYGSASVWAYGSASVRASQFVAVHRFGTAPQVTGGVVIQVPERKTADEWIGYYGLDIEDGHVVLYKAVDDRYLSGHGADYTPGLTVTAEDFEAHTDCGNGLHFGPRPFMAKRYHDAATKYVACRVKVEDIVVIRSYGGPSDKVKARSCEALFECDEDGERLTEAVA